MSRKIWEKKRNLVGGSKSKRTLKEALYEEITHLCGGSNPLNSARFLLAISGGVDSMVLLDLMASVVPPQQLAIAYFDHRLRKNTEKEKKLIQSRCEKLGIKVFVLGARSGKKISENALRSERHRFLEESRLQTQSDFTVLAHHADDQCETFFMRLIRGTSAEGLSGISKKSRRILRPLLNCSKDELIEYALSKDIAYIEDETNESDQFLRNRIRNQVLPLLVEVGKDFGDKKQLVRRITDLTQELALINQQRRKWALNWLAKNLVATPFWWTLGRDRWELLTPEKKQILSRILWRKLTGESLLSEDIRRLEEGILSKKSVTLPGNVQVSYSQDFLHFQSPQHQLAIKQSRNQIWYLCCGQEDHLGLQKELEELGGELRFLEPGDKHQNKKMKRWVEKMGIGKLERPLLPVIAKKGTHELIWFFSLPSLTRYPIHAPWEKRVPVFKINSR